MWDYIGDKWYQVAWWHLRSWMCDTLNIKCPSCKEGDRIEREESQ